MKYTIDTSVDVTDEDQRWHRGRITTISKESIEVKISDWKSLRIKRDNQTNHRIKPLNSKTLRMKLLTKLPSSIDGGSQCIYYKSPTDHKDYIIFCPAVQLTNFIHFYDITADKFIKKYQYAFETESFPAECQIALDESSNRLLFIKSLHEKSFHSLDLCTGQWESIKVLNPIQTKETKHAFLFGLAFVANLKLYILHEEILIFMYFALKPISFSM